MHRASSSIEKLSERGRGLVEFLLGGSASYEEIIAKLKEATGETICRSALSRYRLNTFLPARQRIEAAKSAAIEMAELLKTAGPLEESSDAAAQALFTVFLKRVLEMEQADIAKLSREARLFQAVHLAQRKQDNDAERLGIERQRLALERERLDQAKTDFEAKRARAKDVVSELVGGQQLPPEVVEKIRAIYDL